MNDFAHPPQRVSLPWLVVSIVGAALCAQFALWLASEGSNDIRTWARFARHIERHGVLKLYGTDPLFNHPPLMGLWALQALTIAKAIKLPFALIFKLPSLFANLVAVVVVALAKHRQGAAPSTVAWSMAVVASSLVSALTASFHGNTDALCATLLLITVVLVDRQTLPFVAGLAFAATLNVKLLPLCVAPALFIMQATSVAVGVRFMVGLAIGLVPFLGPIIEAGPAFYTNAIAYNSSPNRWGAHFFFYEVGQAVTQFEPLMTWLDELWAKIARYLILLAGAVFALRARRRRQPAREVAAASMAIFLVLTPGIGVQYFVFPVALIALVDLRRAALYALLSGLFIGAVYVSFSTLELPLQSRHRLPISFEIGLFGVVTWLLLVEQIVFLWRRAPASVPSLPASMVTSDDEH